MSHYKPYPAYKDSGVEWLGHVPEHWKVTQFKWQIERNDGGVWGEDPDGIDDVIVLRSTEQTVDGYWKLEDPASRKLSASDFLFARLLEGDLLVTKSSGSSSHIGKTTLVSSEIENMQCCYSNFMQRIRTKASLLPALAWYVMNNDLARQQFDFLSSTTTGLANLNGTMIGQIQFAVPNSDEQQRIVHHLDSEISRMDRLILRKTKFVKLLREKHQTLITNAITKGINPTATMKFLESSWLRETPHHWQLIPLKYIAQNLTVGIVVNPSEYVTDEGLPFIYGGDITEGRIHFETSRRISNENSIKNSKTRLQAGDLVTVRVGAPGITAVVPPECEGGNCASVMHIRRGDFDSDWLCYAMNSRVVRYQVEVVQYGAAQEQFNISHAVDFLIPVPPYEEQIAIKTHLNQEGLRIDKLIKKTEISLTLLKERRSALITAAVTGQIDLREAS